jgi:hypothetical protein
VIFGELKSGRSRWELHWKAGKQLPVPYQEVRMNRLLLSVAILPFIAAAASAGQPLKDAQMDRVTAGFSAGGFADAQAYGLQVTSQAGTYAETAVLRDTAGAPVAVTIGETTLRVVKSISAGQAVSTATTTIPFVNLPSF